MRAMTRTAAGLAAAMALLTLATGAVLAGGWADATLAPATGDPPVAGEERELRVTLLQHGVTPVDFGSTDMTATNPATGESTTVAATSVGSGEWVASVTFPSGGDWEITVAHSDLAISSLPALSVVGTASATWLPAAFAVGILVAMAIVGIAGVALARSSRRADPLVEVPGAPARAGG